MQKTIVKTPTPQDFLALVPQLVGFLPEQSLVLVAFRGNRTCGALRFNLPRDEAGASELRRIAGTLLGTLCKIPGVDALVPVVYTEQEIGDEPAGAEADLPHGAFLRAIQARAGESGFLVRDALCVAADGWASYLDLGQGRLRPGRAPVAAAGRAVRHPLSDIAASSVAQGIPAGSRREIATLQTGAELPKVDLATRERCARRLARYQRLGPDLGQARLEAGQRRAHPVERDPLVAREEAGLLIGRRGVEPAPVEAVGDLHHRAAEGGRLGPAEVARARGPARSHRPEAGGAAGIDGVDDVGERARSRLRADADGVVVDAGAAVGARALPEEGHAQERQRPGRGRGVAIAEDVQRLVEEGRLGAEEDQPRRHRRRRAAHGRAGVAADDHPGAGQVRREIEDLVHPARSRRRAIGADQRRRGRELRLLLVDEGERGLDDHGDAERAVHAPDDSAARDRLERENFDRPGRRHRAKLPSIAPAEQAERDQGAAQRASPSTIQASAPLTASATAPP